MCAIIDANVVSEVFGEHRPEAGEEFFSWINGGRGVLVVGGRLFQELLKSSAGFRKWAPGALLSGSMMREDAKAVNDREMRINCRGEHRSDDPHILALAQESGARLLYTNDRDLQRDFRNPDILSPVRGRIYTTLVNKTLSPSHKSLLRRVDLCHLQ